MIWVDLLTRGLASLDLLVDLISKELMRLPRHKNLPQVPEGIRLPDLGGQMRSG